MAGGTLTHWIGSRGELFAMGNSTETESYMAQSKELEYIAYRRLEGTWEDVFQVLKIILCISI